MAGSEGNAIARSLQVMDMDVEVANIGDRVHNLSLARIVISNKIGNITINSKIYQSEPWGFELQDSFLNQIIIVETYLNSKEVLTKILNIEKKLGRVRKRKWEP